MKRLNYIAGICSRTDPRIRGGPPEFANPTSWIARVRGASPHAEVAVGVVLAVAAAGALLSTLVTEWYVRRNVVPINAACYGT
jgi:hypothetical protein